MSSFESKVRDALANPQNQGEIPDADAIGTVGSPECGDMLRMWLKFTETDGKRVIDRASFQAFGCQTAIAVASMATELLRGKTAEEAKHLKYDATCAATGSNFSPFALETTGGHRASTATVYFLFAKQLRDSAYRRTFFWASSRRTSRLRSAGARSPQVTTALDAAQRAVEYESALNNEADWDR